MQMPELLALKLAGRFGLGARDRPRKRGRHFGGSSFVTAPAPDHGENGTISGRVRRPAAALLQLLRLHMLRNQKFRSSSLAPQSPLPLGMR